MYTHIFNCVYIYFNVHIWVLRHTPSFGKRRVKTPSFLAPEAGCQWSSTRPRRNALAGARDVWWERAIKVARGDFSICFPFFEERNFSKKPQNLQNHRVVKERMFLWNMIQFVSDLDGFNLTATTIATSRCPSNYDTQYFKLKPRFLIEYWMVVSWFAVVILRSRSPFMIYWLGIHASCFASKLSFGSQTVFFPIHFIY